MMKSVKQLVLAAVVLPLTLGSVSALAYGGKNHHKGPHDQCGMSMDRSVMRQLNLTDAQKEQLQTLRDENRAKMKSKAAENRESRMAERQAHQANMQSLLLAETFDDVQAEMLVKEMVERQAENRVQMLARKHKMLSVLTPEQKAEFVKLQNERMQACDERSSSRKARNN